MTRGKKPLHKDQIKENANKPVSITDISLWRRVVYEGKHKAIIEKTVWPSANSDCQAFAKRKERNCAASLLRFTVLQGVQYGDYWPEKKIKHQKTANIHEYVLPLHTQNKTIRCTEPANWARIGGAVASDILQGYALPESWER